MKKLFIACMVLFSVWDNAYSQNDMSGIYYDTLGRKIEVYHNVFRLIEPRHLVRTMPAVMIDATYDRVSDDLIELHDAVAKSDIDENLVFEQFYDGGRKKNIHVTLSMPQFGHRESVITVYHMRNTNKPFFDVKRVKYFAEKGKTTFKLPSGTKVILITVKPKVYIPSVFENYNGYYNSYVHYATPYFEIDDSTNRISIEIRKLEYSYFVRYAVDGYYVRIDGDKLYWRGRVFIKSTKPEDIEYIEKKKNVIVK